MKKKVEQILKYFDDIDTRPIVIVLSIILILIMFLRSGGIFFITEVLPVQFMEIYEKGQVKIENDWNNLMKVFGKEDVVFEERNKFEIPIGIPELTDEQMDNLSSFYTASTTYFIPDSRTILTEDLFDIETAISSDFSIEISEKYSEKEPQVLIFHTHANEFFIDSDLNKGLSEGVVGVGAELQKILKNDYGISSIHYIDEFDMVNGEGQRVGAYERMDAPIRKILEENPSIEIVLDIHRDGVDEDVHLVTEYNGVDVAKIMFVNGITTLIEDGEPVIVDWLNNPFIQETLGFSLQMQLSAETQFPNYTRKIFLNPYRLSTHMLPRSALVEVGAQTNTFEEAKNSMQLFAKILTDVIVNDND